MRFLLRTFGAVALLAWVGALGVLVTSGASWSTVAYVLATGVLLVGLVTLPDPPGPRARRGRRRGLSRGAVVAIALVAIVRASLTGGGARRLSLITVERDGAATGARFLDRLVDEGDVAVAGARLLFATGIYQDDRAEVPTAMTNAYRAMRGAEGDMASPFAATYLGLERASAFDLVVVEPPPASALARARSEAPRSAVVFLHGFAGGFDLPCWQIANAVARSGALTACPSMRWVADWWSPEGEAILRRTVDVLRARGVSRIVLAGLSNGGFGASRLAPRMKGVFAGLVLVSGAAADAPAAGIPTLVIHGARDTVVGFEVSRSYAARTGARLVSVDAGHFAMLVRADEADRALGDFVAAHVGTTGTATARAATAQ